MRARHEAEVMRAIADLRREGLWSTSRLPKVQEPGRRRALWDYLLEEMQWLATDFSNERRWKVHAAKKVRTTTSTCTAYILFACVHVAFSNLSPSLCAAVEVNVETSSGAEHDGSEVGEGGAAENEESRFFHCQGSQALLGECP